MDVFFADDSKQSSPSRKGLSHLVAVGGIRVREEKVKDLENAIDEICLSYKFPANEEFKWSPSRESWMYSNLIKEQRENFFKDVLNSLIKAGVESTVIIVDGAFESAIAAAGSPELDATYLFLERVCNRLNDGCQATVITDKPGGGAKEESIFIKDCIEALRDDNNYARVEKIDAISCRSSDSTRMLQCADLVTGCTLSHVSGGAIRYSKPIFDVVKQTFAKGRDGIGGIGLKLHPDIRLRNLYHWLLDDNLFWKNKRRWRIPQEGKPYFKDEATV